MTRVLNVLLPGRDKLTFVADFAGWLARGTELAAETPGYLNALAAHFRWPGGPLPAAALIRQAVAGDAGDALWICADPAWVQPELNGARLLGCGNLGVSAADAEAMVSALGETFDEQGMQLLVGDPQHWQLRVPTDMALPTIPEPEEALGADLFEQLPQGAEGRRWRALINEGQVVLHHLPQNASRVRDGLPPVNSVWLWGAGVLPEWVECGQGRIYSDDLLVWALAQQAGIDVQSRAGLLAGGEAGRSIADKSAPTFVLLDLQDVQPSSFDRDWWPLLQSRLTHGDELRLSFADGRRTVLRHRHRLRFWRKP